MHSIEQELRELQATTASWLYVIVYGSSHNAASRQMIEYAGIGMHFDDTAEKQANREEAMF